MMQRLKQRVVHRPRLYIVHDPRLALPRRRRGGAGFVVIGCVVAALAFALLARAL